jgi:nitronate monooxygenase
MTIKTKFTELVGCLVPIQCAGMGMASPVLAAEVARAGGLGMMSGVMLPPDQLELTLQEMQAKISGQIGVNFLIPFLEDEAAIDVAANNACVVDFFFGDPDSRLITKVHDGGALAGWQVGSVKEALAAAESGCDFVILQGTEAGGHVRGTRGLLTMMADVLDAVDCPVVAAGGIATPRAVAMALAAGASAVRIGTRFVATPESGYHPDYINALIASDGEDALYSRQFSVGWDAPHRVLSSCIDAAEMLKDDIIGEVGFGGAQIDVPRNSVFGPMETSTGHLNAMAQYAGQGVSAIKSCKPAADVLRQLTEGAEEILKADQRRLNQMLN